MTIADTFDDHATPEPNTGCLLWTAALDTYGYGQFKFQGRNRLAHRHAFERARGPVPEGMELDHLCRVRCCVNPRHLEAVPHRTNVARGHSPGALAVAMGRCCRGHRLSGLNVGRTPRGGRYCRICNVAATDARRGGPPAFKKASRILLEQWAKENP